MLPVGTFYLFIFLSQSPLASLKPWFEMDDMLGHCSLEIKTSFQITLTLVRGEVQLHRALWPACGSVNMYFQLKPQKQHWVLWTRWLGCLWQYNDLPLRLWEWRNHFNPLTLRFFICSVTLWILPPTFYILGPFLIPEPRKRDDPNNGLVLECICSWEWTLGTRRRCHSNSFPIASCLKWTQNWSLG